MKEKLIILVAEDDENDTFLLRRAFTRNGIDLPVHVCRDGAEAMAYLKGEEPYVDRTKYPFPRALITDLKMPRCSGFDLLEWLNVHPECGVIPTIVLSASAEEQDVTRAYQLGANCYFRKPRSFDELVKVVRLSHEFWTESLIPPLPKNC
jgi:CheY-like chemotaxis protein